MTSSCKLIRSYKRPVNYLGHKHICVYLYKKTLTFEKNVIKKIKNTLREFQAENRQKFENTQAEFKKAVSYIKKSVQTHILRI